MSRIVSNDFRIIVMESSEVHAGPENVPSNCESVRADYTVSPGVGVEVGWISDITTGKKDLGRRDE